MDAPRQQARAPSVLRADREVRVIRPRAKDSSTATYPNSARHPLGHRHPAVGEPALLEHQDVGADAATGVDHVEGPAPPVHAAVHVEAGDDHARHCTGRLPIAPSAAGRPGPPRPASRRSSRSDRRSSCPVRRTISGTLREPAQPRARSADMNWDDVVPECSPQRPPPGDGHPGPPPPRPLEPLQAGPRPPAGRSRPLPSPLDRPRRTSAPIRAARADDCGGPIRTAHRPATTPPRPSPTPSSTSPPSPGGASPGTRCRTSP